jgi:N-hydroxyarylamine O-acetyltransferase
VFDLDAYLARIGLAGRPGIAQVHRAHATSIPFENLDPLRGEPVSLTLEELQSKLVCARRGGYCFEQNLLLKGALESLGAEVEPMLARARVGSLPGVTRPRSHLLLRVAMDGIRWHADVGFGLRTPLEPMPFGPGNEHDQVGWRYRVVEDGPELVLQSAEGDRWFDMYGFLPEPVPMIDIETSNWFTSTHPRSPFVTGLIVTTQDEDGTRVSLSDRSGLELTVHTPEHTRVTPVALQDVPVLLRQHFALGGFALDISGQLVPVTKGPGAPSACG